MIRVSVVAATLAAAVALPSAQGELIQFTFTGTITSTNGFDEPAPRGVNIQVGDSWTLVYVFDSTEPVDPFPPPIANPDATVYQALRSLSVTVGAYAASYEMLPQKGYYAPIVVGNDLPFGDDGVFDGFGASIFDYLSDLAVIVQAIDFTGMVYNDDSIPTDVDLGAFDETIFVIQFGGISTERGEPVEVRSALGEVTGFSRFVIPSPGTGLLLSAAGLGLIARRRR